MTNKEKLKQLLIDVFLLESSEYRIDLKKEELSAAIDPKLLIGRAPAQVSAFLENEFQGALGIILG